MKLINLFGRNIVCPYCFKSFKSQEAMVQCENTSKDLITGADKCPTKYNKEFSEYSGKEMYLRRVYKRTLWNGNNKKGYRCICGEYSTKYVCPHCNNEIPYQMLETGSEIISIVGGPQSGKSTYIVSLMQQLRKYGHKVGLHTHPQDVGRGDEKTTKKQNDGEKRLFSEHTELIKTPIGKIPIPWIFSLESEITKKIIYLVFYDTAGEDFSGSERMRNLQYLKKSKGVIVLLDTLSIPYMKKIIASDSGYSKEKASPFEETVNSLQVFAENNNDLYKKPFAFAFSKIDVIRSHSEDLKFSIENFQNDSSFKETGIFSIQDIEDAHNSLVDYLDDPNIWDSANIFSDLKNKWGENCKLFGVSSTGAPISKETDIRPFRVMDPLIWILYKIGGFGIPTDSKK